MGLGEILGLLFMSWVALMLFAFVMALFEKPKPIAPPESSGVHGSQGLGWTADDLRATATGKKGGLPLLGPTYGQGIRIGACWETGEALRYAGPDAENNITGFGPPGSGKGIAFQSALMEFSGSSVTIDPSGQLFNTCAPELLRRGIRVLPMIPFTAGFPAEVAALAGQSRCLNPMDAITQGDSFESDCRELAQLLNAHETAAQSDQFFSRAGQNLITMLIACVKLYAHPSEQNLPEVFHKLRDVPGYARWITTTQRNIPRFIATQLHRWTTPGAELDKTLRSIVETALAELSWLGDEAIERVLRTSSFGWPDVKNSLRPVALFVLLPVSRLESHKAFLTLCAGAALMGLGKSERGRHQVLLTIDEAALLGHMPIMQRAYAESRKRGVQLSVWFQNIHQAEAIYGPAWKNMLSDIQVHLRPRDLASAQFISSQVGNYTEVIPHVSYSPGRGGMQEAIGYQEQGRPVLFPHDIMALPSGPHGSGNAAIIIAPGRAKNALLVWARPWFDCPDLKDKGGLDPYAKHHSAKGGNRA